MFTRKKEILNINEDDNDFSICQHFIDWKKINYLKNKGNNNYTQLIYEFVKKYLKENKNNDYICKSCGQVLDISNYVTNVYNTGGLEGITININTFVALEEIKEYQKLSKSIKNIDKLIERISYLVGLTQYTGSLPATKLYRQDLIKKIIDIIQLQNTTLRIQEKIWKKK